MASPAVSTPSSAGSPAPTPLAPAPQTLAVKPGHQSPNPMLLSTPTIITKKEWVIPPRPKPGRKPATDTPPTKRKAQNRAAQRAFRERRAARVGELEEQLEEEKTTYEKREQELLGRVARLEEEVRRVGGEVERWRVRSYTVEGMLDWERSEKQRVVEELGVLRFGSRSSGTDAVPLPARRPHNQQQRQQHVPPHIPSRPEVQYASPAVTGAEDLVSGCGNCTATSSCACMEEAIASVTSTGCGRCSAESRCECSEEAINDILGTTTVSVAEPDLKRPLSPSAHGPEESKRQRQEQPTTPLEIDFTAQFARPNPIKEDTFQEVAVVQPNTRAAPIEPCGFCKDGTYCACADMASGASHQAQSQSSLLTSENRLPPLLHEVTPPPSDSDVTSSEANGKLPVWQPKSMHRAVDVPTAGAGETNSCANGPGTCKQCLNDPRSGLFCRSLAKLRQQGGATTSSSSTTTGSGCCGGNSNGGGCCMDKTSPSQSQPQPLSTPTPRQPYTHDQNINNNANSNDNTIRNPPPTLSCAQAYQTLSTHSAFDQATEAKELDTWLGKLNATTDVAKGQKGCEGRGAMEVEAASVMEVLKLFDRRFGRG